MLIDAVSMRNRDRLMDRLLTRGVRRRSLQPTDVDWDPSETSEHAIDATIPEGRHERSVVFSSNSRRVFELVAIDVPNDIDVRNPPFSTQVQMRSSRVGAAPAMNDRLRMPGVPKRLFPMSFIG
jgi:hypothetical protein